MSQLVYAKKIIITSDVAVITIRTQDQTKTSHCEAGSTNDSRRDLKGIRRSITDWRLYYNLPLPPTSITHPHLHPPPTPQYVHRTKQKLGDSLWRSNNRRRELKGIRSITDRRLYYIIISLFPPLHTPLPPPLTIPHPLQYVHSNKLTKTSHCDAGSNDRRPDLKGIPSITDWRLHYIIIFLFPHLHTLLHLLPVPEKPYGFCER